MEKVKEPEIHCDKCKDSLNVAFILGGCDRCHRLPADYDIPRESFWDWMEEE